MSGHQEKAMSTKMLPARLFCKERLEKRGLDSVALYKKRWWQFSSHLAPNSRGNVS